MLNKPRLILDFDGVIVDSIKAYCITYNEKYKLHPNFKKADYTKLKQWDCKDECPLEEKAENIFGSKEFFNNLEFMPNAKKIIQELSNKYHITICSTGTFDNLSYKSIWIKENLPFVNSTILLNHKHSFVDKSIINMKNAIFVDDNANNLISSDSSMSICFGKIYPYNKEWTGTRASNWIELKNKIKIIKNCSSTLEQSIDVHNFRHYYKNILEKGE